MQTNTIQFTPPVESLPSFSDGIMFTFYAVAAAYVIFTAILYYHWQQYSTNKKITWVTLVSYFGITLPIMFVMSILAFTI